MKVSSGPASARMPTVSRMSSRSAVIAVRVDGCGFSQNLVRQAIVSVTTGGETRHPPVFSRSSAVGTARSAPVAGAPWMPPPVAAS